MGLFRRLFRRGHSSRGGVPGRDRAVAGAGYVVLDVETTGLSPEWDRVVEVAVVHVDPAGRASTEWTIRVNPEGPVGATHVHGITEADVAGAPRFAEVIPALTAHLQGRAVTAHNADFDLAFLRAEYTRAGWQLPWLPALCTYQASYHYLPALGQRSLAGCCAAARIPLCGAHSALGDSRAAAALLAHYLNPKVRPAPLREHLDLPRQAAEVVWPTRAVARDPYRAPPRPAAPSLAATLLTLPLADALDEGAPPGTMSYLQLLTEVLSDGDRTDGAAGLTEVALVHGLTAEGVATAHSGFLLALAHRAVADGQVSAAERADLLTVARLLQLPESLVRDVLARAEAARHARLGARLVPLPSGWAHGEPLRVGDKVVVTGCDPQWRARFEARAERLGVRVLGTVSGRTAMLVSERTTGGVKDVDATRLGTRTVFPREFEVLLAHLQPARLAAQSTNRPAAPVQPPLHHQSVPLFSLRAEDPGRVRRWALDQGLAVSARGRLPADVVTAYRNAHPDSAAAENPLTANGP